MIGFSQKGLRLTAFVGGVGLRLAPMTVSAVRMDPAGDDGWIDRLLNGVLIAQAAGPDTEAAAFEPYLGQLIAVRTALARGDEAAVIRGINRFIGRLETRANGISAKTATWLVEYCYAVTPAKFHDVNRHLGTDDPRRWWDEMIGDRECAKGG